MRCKGDWVSISSDSVGCRLCGYVTHWANSREHNTEDAEIQKRESLEFQQSLSRAFAQKGIAYPPAVTIILCFLLFFVAGCGAVANRRDSGTGDYLQQAGAVRWQKREVLYWIAPQSGSVPGVDPRRTVERGLRKWQVSLGNRLLLTKTENETAADIRVRFGTKDDLGTDQGRTALSYADPNRLFLQRAEMMIYRGLTPWQMEVTSIHEMGHGLGWRSHVNEQGSIMYYYPRFWIGISPKDARTMQAIYAANAL